MVTTLPEAIDTKYREAMAEADTARARGDRAKVNDLQLVVDVLYHLKPHGEAAPVEAAPPQLDEFEREWVADFLDEHEEEFADFVAKHCVPQALNRSREVIARLRGLTL